MMTTSTGCFAWVSACSILNFGTEQTMLEELQKLTADAHERDQLVRFVQDLCAAVNDLKSAVQRQTDTVAKERKLRESLGTVAAASDRDLAWAISQADGATRIVIRLQEQVRGLIIQHTGISDSQVRHRVMKLVDRLRAGAQQALGAAPAA